MPCKQLKELKLEKIIQVDTSDEDSIIATAEQLKDEPIGLLIDNAGIGGETDSTRPLRMMKQFEVNTIGPFLMTRAFLPNLKLVAAKSGSAKVVHVSSRMGSIACTDIGGLFGYRASKVALNMVTSRMT